MEIKLSKEQVRNYEIIIDNIHTYRTLLLICSEAKDKELDNEKIYSEYQACKDRLIEWIYDMESKYNINLFGNKYRVDVNNNQLIINKE